MRVSDDQWRADRRFEQAEMDAQMAVEKIAAAAANPRDADAKQDAVKWLLRSMKSWDSYQECTTRSLHDTI